MVRPTRFPRDFHAISTRFPTDTAIPARLEKAFFFLSSAVVQKHFLSVVVVILSRKYNFGSKPTKFCSDIYSIQPTGYCHLSHPSGPGTPLPRWYTHSWQGAGRTHTFTHSASARAWTRVCDRDCLVRRRLLQQPPFARRSSPLCAGASHLL